MVDALARAGLRPPERFMPLYPHEVSGGQRQRVVIAGAMVMEPTLLLADEPVASLDASIRGEILALMRSLVDTHGLSIIAVTHDLGLAWNIADRIAVMYLGRIVEIGGAEEVLANPQHPYTRALLSVVPEMEGMEQQILHGETPDPRRIPPGCRFHPRCPVVASARPHGSASPAAAAARTSPSHRWATVIWPLATRSTSHPSPCRDRRAAVSNEMNVAQHGTRACGR